jgi:hypothetical protein
MLDDERDGFAERMADVGVQAVVLELAFLTHPDDLPRLQRDAGWLMIWLAESILKAWPPGA